MNEGCGDPGCPNCGGGNDIDMDCPSCGAGVAADHNFQYFPDETYTQSCSNCGKPFDFVLEVDIYFKPVMQARLDA